jgi:NAD(P)-dependent dehydrogenase (short-subunit alcohol dehydrogenase family)
MEDLRDRVAVVTGGASGIGAALARAFAAAGMRVVLADIDAPAMARVADTIGGDTLAVRTDVTRLEDVQALAARTVAHFGAVHVICNNAGVALYGGLDTLTHRDWQWIVNVNLWGVIHGIEVFVPRLIAQGQGGHLVNTASMAGLVPMQGMGAYVTTKYAVVGLSETLQRDLSGYGIGVSVLCPMVVRTNIFNSESSRPAELRNPGAPPAPAEVPAPPEGMAVGGIIEADEVAARVVAAVRANELYVLTHRAQRDILRRRCERLDRAAARV